MARNRSWESLSDSYANRLMAAGVDRQAYESGMSLVAARGHAGRLVDQIAADLDASQTTRDEIRKAVADAYRSGLTTSEIRQVHEASNDLRDAWAAGVRPGDADWPDLPEGFDASNPAWWYHV